MKKIATRLSSLFSYYIVTFYDIFNFKFYHQLIYRKTLCFLTEVFQQTDKKETLVIKFLFYSLN